MSNAHPFAGVFSAPANVRSIALKRRKALAVGIAAVFAIGETPAIAASTWTVTSCADSGSGTLRDVVAASTTLSGDTVDLSHLTTSSPGCSSLSSATISLQTGAIAISQSDLTLHGPGVGQLVITRAMNHDSYFYTYDRILSHSGTGTLRIDAMTISDGDNIAAPMGTAKGGCIYSNGNLVAMNVAIDGCIAAAPSKGSAYGGAIYTHGDASLTNSTMSDNGAGVYGDVGFFATYGKAIGGALFSGGGVTLTNSTITKSSLISHGNGDVGYGGGIHSSGAMTLTNTTVSNNLIDATSTAYGGAIHAVGGASFTLSNVSGNSAMAILAVGGGIWTSGNLSATNTLIGSNRAIGQIVSKYSSFLPESIGGGAIVEGNATITSSAIVQNYANGHIGGIEILSEGSGSPTMISNSTISDNRAYIIGGAYARLPATFQSTTIAFNTAKIPETQQGSTVQDAAVGLVLHGNAQTATLQSVLISNNIGDIAGPFTNSVESDLSTLGTTPTIDASSANNLIRISAMTNLPADTIKTACPLLGSLRNDGAATPTRALLSRSPAIDTGNNAAASAFDQRGSPFGRISGPHADIGAYEVQKADIVFNSGFDGCPD